MFKYCTIFQGILFKAGIAVDTEEVFIKKMGNVILLLPIKNPWDSLFQSLDKFSADFMETREQPDQQTREDIFL